MENRSSLTQITTTACRRSVQGDFALYALTDQSPIHDLPLIILTTIVEAACGSDTGVGLGGSGGRQFWPSFGKKGTFFPAILSGLSKIYIA